MQVITRAVYFSGKDSITRLLWQPNCIYLFCQYLTDDILTSPLLNVFLTPRLVIDWFLSPAEIINYKVKLKEKIWSSHLANPDSLLYRELENEIHETVIKRCFVIVVYLSQDKCG